jgi:hypothetical protein
MSKLCSKYHILIVSTENIDSEGRALLSNHIFLHYDYVLVERDAIPSSYFVNITSYILILTKELS